MICPRRHCNLREIIYRRLSLLSIRLTHNATHNDFLMGVDPGRRSWKGVDEKLVHFKCLIDSNPPTWTLVELDPADTPPPPKCLGYPIRFLLA